MYPAKFEYYRAGSLEEALSLLQQHSDAKVLAGGHSLIPMMKLRLAQPAALIDLGRLRELSGISETDGVLRIGALTSHTELAGSEILHRRCLVLADAAAQIADPQVRNLGTIGGNLAHADPASDLPAVILLLNGTLHIAGPSGTRQVQAGDFFQDLLATDLRPDEILTAVEVEALDGRTGSCYLKFENPASGYAVCGAAALVQLASDGSCQRAGLCFNGVTAVPYVAEVGPGLSGKQLDDSTIDQLVGEVVQPPDAMSDLYASAAYRAELARVYGRRALKLARDRAQR